jgi:hypothetical protein
MQKHTRSILEELDSIYEEKFQDRDRRYIIESRATNVIASAIRLIEQIESAYPADQAENLVRKLLNAIRDKDSRKFTRTVRRTDADS